MCLCWCDCLAFVVHGRKESLGTIVRWHKCFGMYYVLSCVANKICTYLTRMQFLVDVKKTHVPNPRVHVGVFIWVIRTYPALHFLCFVRVLLLLTHSFCSHQYVGRICKCSAIAWHTWICCCTPTAWHSWTGCCTPTKIQRAAAHCYRPFA